MNILSFNTSVQTPKTQAELSPNDALEILKAGNKRFVNNQRAARHLTSQMEATTTGQYPFATVLSCIDSRVPAEHVFDQGIGDIFSVRIAGNFVNEDILGSMEFATKLAGTKLLVILGHTACGAIKGACDNAKLGNLTGMLDKLQPAVKAVTSPSEPAKRTSKNLDFVNDVVSKNVELTIDNIMKNSPVMAEMVKEGSLKVVGAIYDLATGKVKFNK